MSTTRLEGSRPPGDDYSRMSSDQLAGLVDDSPGDGDRRIQPSEPPSRGGDAPESRWSHYLSSVRPRIPPVVLPAEIKGDVESFDAADAAVHEARDEWEAARQAVRAADAVDREAAVAAFEAGATDLPPTRRRLEAQTLVMERQLAFAARLDIAWRAAIKLEKRLIEVFPEWRGAAMAAYEANAAKALEAVDAAEHAINATRSALNAVEIIDRKYGTRGVPRDARIEATRPENVRPTSWQPPEWHGVGVYGALMNGPSRDPRMALRFDFGSIRAWLKRRPLSHRWTPGSTPEEKAQGVWQDPNKPPVVATEPAKTTSSKNIKKTSASDPSEPGFTGIDA